MLTFTVMAYQAVRGWEDDYTSSIDELSSQIRELKDLLGGPLKARAEAKMEDIDKRITNLKELRRSYNFELKLVKEHDLRKDYQAVAVGLDKRRDDLMAEVAPLRERVMQNKAKGDEDLTFLSNGKVNMETQGRSNDQLLSGAATIQELTKASVARSQALIDNSKEVGKETNVQLKEQRQKLQEIDAEAQSIHARLEKSRDLIATFGRRIAGDRIIQIFCAINIVILLVFIFYIIATGRELKSLFMADDDETMAPSTAPTLPPARRFRG